jgi:hypothetical protein
MRRPPERGGTKKKGSVSTSTTRPIIFFGVSRTIEKGLKFVSIEPFNQRTIGVE